MAGNRKRSVSIHTTNNTIRDWDQPTDRPTDRPKDREPVCEALMQHCGQDEINAPPGRGRYFPPEFTRFITTQYLLYGRIHGDLPTRFTMLLLPYCHNSYVARNSLAVCGYTIVVCGASPINQSINQPTNQPINRQQFPANGLVGLSCGSNASAAADGSNMTNSDNQWHRTCYCTVFPPLGILRAGHPHSQRFETFSRIVRYIGNNLVRRRPLTIASGEDV